MNLREALRISLRGLRANRLRSALTTLGIVIGVSAVILLVAIGNGVQNSVNERIEPLANLITVVPTVGNVPGGTTPKDLIDADIAALQKREQAPDIATVIPAATGPTLAETDTVKFRTRVVGSTERWLEVNNQDLQAGSFFNEAQVRTTAKVVVLGPTVATGLFGDNPAAAIRKTIRINRQNFTVIGVMQAVGEPFDSNAVMPLDTARRYVFGGGDKINQIIVQATQAAAVPAAEDQVTRILSDRHRIKDAAKRDFEVQSLRSRLDTFNQILTILTLFTASVAAISLVVGAIGVLNIMLVSITERTREIGIRKAIGATRTAILQQFLIEAIVLASVGGLIGVGVGVGLAELGAAIAPSLGPTLATFAPAVSIPSIVVAFAISLAIGLLAGGYPANRAARLRPVDALRYE
ncbi:MAG TPA: ABC transporter permease [Pseudonocardiaceae bacterium]|nr:ABC transporter permease [Pseudonocardiaceae bacterium]